MTNLRNGFKKSCGCLNKETRSKNATNMGKKNLKDFTDRFFKYVDKTGSCWNWIGDIGEQGYGRIWYKGKTRRTHRMSYEMHNGIIPDELCVCHLCDNPKCVNPDHLFLGTIADNNFDKKIKGRASRGEKSGMSKLKDIEVQEIKRLLNNSNMNGVEIADKFNVSSTTIYYIRDNKTWAHLVEGIK